MDAWRTRNSIVTLARDEGRRVEERRVSVDGWRSGIMSSQIVEAFICGAAAVITPIGRLKWRGGGLPIGQGDTIGPVVTEFRECLLDIQYGHVADNHGWVHRLGTSLAVTGGQPPFRAAVRPFGG